MRPLIAWAAALFGVIILQSSVLPLFVPDPWRPDLTRALVLWLALTGVPRRGPFLALGGGAAVDWISGAPIGFTAFTRLVLYGLCRPFRGVFFDHHPLLLVPFAAAGALADAGLSAAVSVWVLERPLVSGAAWAVGWRQGVVDALWVPAVFIALELATGRRTPRLVPG